MKLGVNGKKLGKQNEKAAIAYYQGIKKDVIVSLGKTRKRTLQHYADTLNRSGIQTRCNGKWYPQTVKNMFKHLQWDTKAPSFAWIDPLQILKANFPLFPVESKVEGETSL